MIAIAIVTCRAGMRPLGQGAAVENMDVGSWILLGLGTFVAVSALVGLMRWRRDELFAELTAQAREEQHRQRVAEELQKKKQKRLAS